MATHAPGLHHAAHEKVAGLVVKNLSGRYEPQMIQSYV